MQTTIRQALRARVPEPVRRLKFVIPQRLRFERERWLAPRATRLLLVSDRDAYCSEQQLAPFHTQRRQLREQLNLIFHHRLLAEVLAQPEAALRGADVIGLKLSFRKTAREAQQIVSEIRRHKGEAKLIYFDGDDDSTIEWPDVLPLVDLWVKKHIFSDLSQYQAHFVGRNNLTDFVASHHGYDFRDDPIPASTPVDPTYLDRLHLAYNLAWDDKIVALYRRTRDCWSRTDRPNDIVCRAQLTGWLAPLRGGIAPALAPLHGRYRMLLPTERVSQDAYDRELASSKICISPLGYGEICWRDFEAVLWGCLMVKPRMDGITTRPNIFVPYETYVPVAWDLSDLASMCEHYLERPEQRLRITRQAYAVLSEYYEQQSFIEEVARILQRVGLPSWSRA